MKTKVTYLSKLSILFLIGVISMDLVSCFAQSPWTQKKDMLYPLRGHSACVLDGKIYIMGGREIHTPLPEDVALDSVAVYDPVLDTWSSKAKMLSSRLMFSSCAYDGKIYAIGGSKSIYYSPVSSIDAYDPDYDTWSHITDIPKPGIWQAATLFEDKIYIFGGSEKEAAIPYNTVQVYDLLAETWTVAEEMPTPRSALTAVTANGKIYVIGGLQWGGSNELSTVEVFDPVTNSWSTKADMLMPVRFHSCVELNGKIYVFGGGTGYCQLLPIDGALYDPEKDQWTEISSDLWEFGLGTFVAYEGKAFGSGGLLTPCSSSSIKTVYEYNPHYDLLPIVGNTFTNKNSINAENDSVLLSNKILDPKGISTMAIIRDPDGVPIDSLHFYDDGNHGDGAAGDSIFANYWRTVSGEEMEYYMDLKATKIGTDTVVNYFKNSVIITTDELVTTADFSNKDSTCSSFLGDCIWTSLTLQNNSTQYAAKNIKAKLESLDSLVSVFNPFRYYDSIPSGSHTTPESIQIIMSNDFSDSIVPIVVHISSYDSIFRSDTFSIVVPPTNVNDLKSPIVKIYPNPANDRLTIETSQPGQHFIEITSLNGQLLYSDRMEGPTHQIDLSSFEKGLYFITVRSRDYMRTERIIKL